MHFIAWDILLTSDGPCIIEANTSSGINIIQLWGPQRNGELGDFYRAHRVIGDVGQFGDVGENVAIHRYVIMANGKGIRWNDYLGIPKHLISVEEETHERIVSKTN